MKSQGILGSYVKFEEISFFVAFSVTDSPILTHG